MAINRIPPDLRTSKRDAAFWRRIDVGSVQGCWLWKVDTQLTGGGYGAAYYHATLHTTAHRIAYMLVKGSIPDGMSILHSCDVRRCCNPNHLFPGTAQDNSDDMIEKGRWSRKSDFKGDGNPNARIADTMLPQLFADAKSMTQRQLGEKYGISKTQVGNILRGESRPDANVPKVAVSTARLASNKRRRRRDTSASRI